MNDPQSRLSRRYPDAMFATLFNDGREVPWRALTLGELIEYLNDIISPQEIKENNLFLKCVEDQYLKDNIAILKAGTISTTVQNIIDNSFPVSALESNYVLNFFRYQLDTTTYHDLLILITEAFPALKPDDILDMQYEKFMYHVSLAERRLLRTGAIEKPVEFYDPEAPEQPKKKEKPLDPSKIKESYDNQSRQPPRRPPDGTSYVPCPEPSGKPFVVTKDDIKEGIVAANKDVKADYQYYQDKMLNDTIGFYSDYLEKIEEHGKITSDMIKSPEEREAEALERMKESKVKFQTQVEEQRKIVAKQEERLEEMFKQGLGKRGKKKKRRR